MCVSGSATSDQQRIPVHVISLYQFLLISNFTRSLSVYQSFDLLKPVSWSSPVAHEKSLCVFQPLYSSCLFVARHVHLLWGVFILKSLTLAINTTQSHQFSNLNKLPKSLLGIKKTLFGQRLYDSRTAYLYDWCQASSHINNINFHCLESLWFYSMTRCTHLCHNTLWKTEDDYSFYTSLFLGVLFFTPSSGEGT